MEIIKVQFALEIKIASVSITGTSKGIGLESVLTFGREGTRYSSPCQSFQIAGTGRNSGARETPDHCHTMDVDSDQSVNEAIHVIQNERGPVNILVNNAGIERAGSVKKLALNSQRDIPPQCPAGSRKKKQTNRVCELLIHHA